MRSERNYPHQLAARLGAHLIDLTVAGATTANLLDTPQETIGGAWFPPQLDGVPAGADVVTITAGGNDLSFIGSMLSVAWSRVDPTSPIASLLASMVTGPIPTPDDVAVDGVTRGLSDVVEAVASKAASARIMLVDYLHPLDAASSAATPFEDDEVTAFLRLQGALDQAISDAASRTGAELIAASSLSAGHALGSLEPWVQPFADDVQATAGSFHPNDTGMAAIAIELERTLSV